MGAHEAAGAPWRLPGYTLGRLLGSGAAGEVWQARVNSSGDRVALKRLPMSTAEQARAARSEAALLRALDHPNLVRLHEFVAVPDAAVLVLDLAEGGSLADLLAARGRLTPGETVAALAPIGAALAYAHANGVVHGDVTPANVLFSAAGLPLLADLGIARLSDASAPPRCTPAYADPAVVAGWAPGPATDVFMLAATALHALCGQPLWPAETGQRALTQAAVGDTGAALQRLDAAEAPEPMVAVLRRALSCEPQRRGTAAEFALELRHSAEPVAVELHAGRERPVPRRAAGVPDDPDVGSGAPRHARSPALTHGARLPPPRLPRRSWLARRSWPARRRPALLLAAGCAAALLAVVSVLWWPGGGHRSAAAAVRTTPAAHTNAATSARAASSSAPPGPSPRRSPTHTPTPARSTHPGAAPPTRIGAHALAAVLARLDSTRARAFATRDAGLLGRVYVAGPLLEHDTALLNSIVPRGCGLYGAHTAYRGLSIDARTTTTVALTATATLSVSSLRCAGRASRTARGTGPVSLHITLVRHGSGYRIAAQHR